MLICWIIVMVLCCCDVMSCCVVLLQCCPVIEFYWDAERLCFYVGMLQYCYFVMLL